MIDGNPATPEQLRSLPPGPHILRLSKPGFVSKTDMIMVEPGKKFERAFELVPLSEIAITCMPGPCAEIRIDGKPADPARLPPLEPGPHTVNVSKAGFVSHNPSCDDVIDQGRSLGPSPIIHHSVKPGQHRITLKKGPMTKVITAILVSGQVTAERVTMK